MKPICVIPARRGSKRLPLKNIRTFAGRPMLAYSIDAAVDSGLFEVVTVSTEDDEIAGIARSCGAYVHCRPAALADDATSATDVCLDAADGQAVDAQDAIVCLQPSSPLRSADDIRGCWDEFVARRADFLVSVTAIDPHYFHWAVHDSGAGWAPWFGDRYIVGPEAMPPVFRPNGSVKIARLAPLRELQHFFGSPLAAFETPESRSIHVASQADFIMAEALLRAAR